MKNLKLKDGEEVDFWRDLVKASIASGEAPITAVKDADQMILEFRKRLPKGW